MKDPVLKQNMTKSLVCIQWNAAIEKANEIMEQRRIRHLPVTDSVGIVVGILSDRDVKRAMNPERPAFKAGLIVGDFMSWPPLMVKIDTPIQEIAEEMVEEKISAFLVTSNEKVVGIVTSEDLLQLLAKILAENKNTMEVKLSSLLFQPVVQEAIRELEGVGI